MRNGHAGANDPAEGRQASDYRLLEVHPGIEARRLKDATAGDVTQFLGLLAQQPDSAGWKVRQADHALQILFQELIRSACPLDG